MKHPLFQIRAAALFLCFLLLFAWTAGCAETPLSVDTGSRDLATTVTSPPGEQTLAQYLAMSDPELAAATGITLEETKGAYFVRPAGTWDMEAALENPCTNPLQPNSFTITVPKGDGSETPEQVGLLLAKRYLHGLMSARLQLTLQTSFLITAYKNVTVQVYDRETVPEQFLHREATLDDSGIPKWYVVLSFDYQYAGYVDEHGRSDELPADTWVHFEGGEQDFCFGFILLNDLYSFGSDYLAPDAPNT